MSSGMRVLLGACLLLSGFIFATDLAAVQVQNERWITFSVVFFGLGVVGVALILSGIRKKDKP